jgi:hypothetical protein
MKGFIFFILLSASCFGEFLETDSILGNSHKIQANDTFLLKIKPITTHPKTIACFDSAIGIVKQCSTSMVGAAPYDSAGKAHYADSSGLSHLSDSTKSYGMANHGVDSSYLPFSTGGNTWGSLPLRYYGDSVYSFYNDYLYFVNKPFAQNKFFHFACPDSTSLKIGPEYTDGYGTANGARLILFSNHACCYGSFELLDGGQSAGSHRYGILSSHRLELWTDSVIDIRSPKLCLIEADSMLKISFDTLLFLNRSLSRNARIKFGTIGGKEIVPVLSMTDSIPLLRGDGILGRISKANFKTGIGFGCDSLQQIDDTHDTLRIFKGAKIWNYLPIADQ